MRTKSVRSVVAAVVLAGATGLWVNAATGSASADVQPVTLPAPAGHSIAPVASVADLVVDGLHQHVLLSDPSENRIVALNYDGSAAGAIARSATLLLSADQKTLYAGADDQTIIAYDAATLTESARYPIGVSPSRMTEASGRLWFSYGESFGSVNVADGAVTLQDPPGDLQKGLIASHGGLVALTSGPGVSSGTLYLFDVTKNPPLEVARHTVDDHLSYYRELAFTADGKQLVVGGAGGFELYDAGTLSPVSGVETGRFAALRSMTGGILLAERPHFTEPELSLYSTGSTTPAREWDIPITEQYAPDISGMASEPNGSRVFTLTTDWLGRQTLWTLNTTPPAPPATPALTVNGNGTVSAYGTTYSLTAHLGSATTNRTVQIWADPYGADQAKRLLKSGTVDSKGNFTVSLKLTRNTSVSAVFSGDAGYAARTVTSTLYTRPAVSTAVAKHYKTASSYYYFHKTANPRFTTTMTAYPNRKQKLFFEYYSGTTWHAWHSYLVAVDSAGHSTYTLTGTHKTGTRYRVRAAYLTGTSGDNVNYSTYGAYKYFTFTK